ncbi:MAG TPA: hypothetical protein VKE27_09555, partial [Candidatus Dormibacteraeota bacterium]|nr:hypothetical protein [Candidatus Dormibacteraeota bacterium]
MDPDELESDFTVEILPTRILRATALIAASLVAIVATAVFYVDPQVISIARHGGLAAQNRAGANRISAIEFVTPSVGWVVADLSNGDFAVLHTSDGGVSWTHQLSA